MTDTFARRRFVALLCGTAAAGVAGCAEPGGDEVTPGGGAGEDSPEPQEGPVVEPNNTGEQQPGMGPAEENETLEEGVDPDPREGAGTEAAGNESAGDGAGGGAAGNGAAGGENGSAGAGNENAGGENGGAGTGNATGG